MTLGVLPNPAGSLGDRHHVLMVFSKGLVTNHRLLCITAKLVGECPLWVISGHDVIKSRCPLYPQKRTSVNAIAMSALCQKRTLRSAAIDRTYWGMHC